MRRTLLLAGAAAAALTASSCGVSSTKTTTTTTSAAAPAAPGARPARGASGATGARRTSAADQGGAQVGGGAGGGGALLGAAGQAGVTDGTAPNTGIRPFNADSPWNTKVDTLPVDANSDTWITKSQTRIGVVEDGINAARRVPVTVHDGLYVNTKVFTDPVVDETGGVPTTVICRQTHDNNLCGDGDEVSSLLIPPTANPLPQYDGWLTVLNRSTGFGYDLWRARRAEGSNVISYQYLRKWDLNGPGFLEPNAVSARGSGLPLFGGLILPQEIQAGRIDHALAIALPGPAQRRYVQPASSTDGNGDVDSIPEGARIRLKSSVQLSLKDIPGRTNQKAAKAIFQALKTYGAIVVDRSQVPSLFAQLNANWGAPLEDGKKQLLGSDGKLLPASIRGLPGQSTPLLRGSEVEQLKITDFEVVQTKGQVQVYPPVGTRGAATAATSDNAASTGQSAP